MVVFVDVVVVFTAAIEVAAVIVLVVIVAFSFAHCAPVHVEAKASLPLILKTKGNMPGVYFGRTSFVLVVYRGEFRGHLDLPVTDDAIEWA